MIDCKTVARKIAERFPVSPGSLPTNNWLAKSIKNGISPQTILGKKKIVTLDWNPKKNFSPGSNCMFIRRIACLLASGMANKADSLIEDAKEKRSLELVEEASRMIQYALPDIQELWNQNDIAAFAVASSFAVAGFYAILMISDQDRVTFPVNGGNFTVCLTPTFDIPIVEGYPSADILFSIFIMTRIDIFSRISVLCVYYNGKKPYDLSDFPEFLSDDAITTTFLNRLLFLSKIFNIEPQNWQHYRKPAFLWWEIKCEINKEVLNGIYPVSEKKYHKSMPANLPPSYQIRQEILKNITYQLWPGLSEIQWKENDLIGLRLLPMPDQSIMAIVRLKYKDFPLAFEIVLHMPSIRNDVAWNSRRIEAEKRYVSAWHLSPVMEAIRMCVTPREIKIRDNRVPSGFVTGSRKPSSRKGDIAVTYLPKYRILDANKTKENVDITHGTMDISRKMRIGHQVAAFLRQLPGEQKASEAARINAQKRGIRLPESGYTFVKPHVRGEFYGKKFYRIMNKGNTKNK
jgi:hypothetical protein